MNVPGCDSATVSADGKSQHAACQKVFASRLDQPPPINEGLHPPSFMIEQIYIYMDFL